MLFATVLPAFAVEPEIVYQSMSVQKSDDGTTTVYYDNGSILTISAVYNVIEDKRTARATQKRYPAVETHILQMETVTSNGSIHCRRLSRMFQVYHLHVQVHHTATAHMTAVGLSLMALQQNREAQPTVKENM